MPSFFGAAAPAFSAQGNHHGPDLERSRQDDQDDHDHHHGQEGEEEVRQEVTAALFERFDAYMAVMVETPYCPDRVQALGMAFADQWNSDKALICDRLGENPDDFDYSKWRSWVPKLRPLTP